MTPILTMPSEKKALNRWWYVWIGVLIMLMFGVIDAWSVFVLPLEKEFGWRRDETSLTFSLIMIFFAVGILFGGLLIDRKGPRLMFSIVGIVLGAGLVVASFTQSLLHLYLSYGVVCGLSVGVAYISVISTVIRWFPDYRGAVSGLLMMGFGFGGMFLGVGASRLIEMLGWRGAFQIFGVITFLFIVLLGRCLRPWSASGDGRVRPAAPSAAIVSGHRQYTWRETLSEPTFWCLWFWQLSVIAGGLAAIGHIVPLAVEKGFAGTEAATALGLLSISNGLGRVCFGILHDRLGNVTVMLIDSTLMALAMLLFANLSLASGFSGLLLCAGAAGLGYGGAMPQVSAVIAARFGAKHFGANFGLVSTGILFAALLGPYLSGVVRMISGNYSLCFLFLAGFACSGMIVGLRLRAPEGRS